MDDGTIKEDFNELYRQMNGMELREMDKIIYPVCPCAGIISDPASWRESKQVFD